jgi:HEAT repeat protein
MRSGKIRGMITRAVTTTPYSDGAQMDSHPARPIQLLVSDLLDRDPVVRRAAEIQVAALPVPTLLAALHDPDPDVRLTATDEVARLHGPRAIEAWLLLPTNANSFLRGDLLVNLANANDPRVLSVLTAALKDRSSAVRARAAYALRERGDPAAIEPLLRCLTDKVIAVRQAAVEALGVLRAGTAVDRLLALLSHSNKYLRRSVVTALEHIADPKAIQPLITCLSDKDTCVRQLAACTLGSFSTAAVPFLLDALADHNRAIRRGAIHALGHIGGKQVRAAIVGKRDDRSKEVREEVERALQMLDRHADTLQIVPTTA